MPSRKWTSNCLNMDVFTDSSVNLCTDSASDTHDQRRRSLHMMWFGLLRTRHIRFQIAAQDNLQINTREHISQNCMVLPKATSTVQNINPSLSRELFCVCNHEINNTRICPLNRMGDQCPARLAHSTKKHQARRKSRRTLTTKSNTPSTTQRPTTTGVR